MSHNWPIRKTFVIRKLKNNKKKLFCWVHLQSFYYFRETIHQFSRKKQKKHNLEYFDFLFKKGPITQSQKRDEIFGPARFRNFQNWSRNWSRGIYPTRFSDFARQDQGVGQGCRITKIYFFLYSLRTLLHTWSWFENIDKSTIVYILYR